MKTIPEMYREVIIVFVGSILGAIGSSVRYVARMQDNELNVQRGATLWQAFIGGFCGTLAALFMLDQNISYKLILAGAGIAGFWGVGALFWATKKFSGQDIQDSEKACDKPRKPTNKPTKENTND